MSIGFIIAFKWFKITVIFVPIEKTDNNNFRIVMRYSAWLIFQ